MDGSLRANDSFQEIPLSELTYITPSPAAAASFVPSVEQAMEFQLLLGAFAAGFHVTPESELTYIPFPAGQATAASLLPSADEVTDVQ